MHSKSQWNGCWLPVDVWVHSNSSCWISSIGILRLHQYKGCPYSELNAWSDIFVYDETHIWYWQLASSLRWDMQQTSRIHSGCYAYCRQSHECSASWSICILYLVLCTNLSIYIFTLYVVVYMCAWMLTLYLGLGRATYYHLAVIFCIPPFELFLSPFFHRSSIC